MAKQLTTSDYDKIFQNATQGAGEQHDYAWLDAHLAATKALEENGITTYDPQVRALVNLTVRAVLDQQAKAKGEQSNG